MIIEVNNSSYGWLGRPALFEGVNLSLDRGEVLAILGPNGIGKTTLLKSLIGLIPWKKGATFVESKDIKSYKVSDLYKIISYVPQAKAPPFSLTAMEMILLGRNPHINIVSSPKQKDYEIAHQVIDRLGIEYLTDVKVNKMSGGELQMVLIARALVNKPKVLILDEPESNLDFRNQLKILNIIKYLAKEEKIACIFNTHYPQHAFRVADKALLLGRDKNYLFGEVNEILTKENIKKFFQVEVSVDEISANDMSLTTITPLYLI